MLRIAGVDLMVTTPEVTAWIEKVYDTSLFVPWLRRSWPGPGQVFVSYPVGIRDIWIDHRVNKLNKFYWPSGASRWAFGHFVVGADQIDGIRPIAYGPNSDQMNMVPMTISCPGQRSSEVLNVSVYVLSCQPIGGMTGYENVNPPYIITVVDQRYYWYNKATLDFGIDDTSTWTYLFNYMSIALGTTINVDTISPNYLQPSRGLNISYEYLPAVLDAMCYNVGHRLICRYDNTVWTQQFSSANNALQADFANFPERTVRGGGSKYLDVS